MLKRSTLLFNSFCSNLAKESCTFLLPILPKLYLLINEKRSERFHPGERFQKLRFLSQF